ncbi:MAG: Asp-tRNA(Asn)/Glu-tRNA(Gln) amidotransferase subunit GatB [Actinobacteria bacterium]|nr:Asp-tRNA(Asn)/Glu-tRNA(Gln) amidotransferase subunit GatB [Actinomycetota bacterium]
MSLEKLLKEKGYEAVIGLEIHTELQTNSKMFCGCPARVFGLEPNTAVCPICLGLPGTLPVPNQKAVEWTVKIALALNCKINEFSQFHRKNYFYPDMPKNYQISQYDYPIGVNGYLEIETSKGQKRIRIHRVHLEEDTGKLVHVGRTGRISEAEYSLIDFNRAGVPLVEIVTEADIETPEEAKVFMQTLRSVLLTLEVSDCNMEEGSLRCDANVSIRPKGSTSFGTKTEIKNLNSFRALEKGLEYEIKRQLETVLSGKKVVQETRHWDDANKRTVTLRTKEEAHDYRYFPEPDMVPMEISTQIVEKIRSELPELPFEKKKRFIREYSIKEKDAGILVSDKEMAEFFEEAARLSNNPQAVANIILSELLYHLNESDVWFSDIRITPKHISDLVNLLESGKISSKIAKEVFAEAFKTGKNPEEIVRERGLEQISDDTMLESIIYEVLNENPQAVKDFKEGKKQAIGFLVGQVMKKTQGKANPQMVNEKILEILSNN